MNIKPRSWLKSVMLLASLVAVAASAAEEKAMPKEDVVDDSDGRLLGFAIAGKDRRFYPAEVNWFADGKKDSRNRPRLDRRVLVLTNRFVPEPLHYRYAWSRNPMGNIVNNRGVPLAAQRSDDWILEETPVKFAAPNETSEDAARRQAANLIRKELERDDLDRRIKETEATIAELKPLVDRANVEREKRNALK